MPSYNKVIFAGHLGGDPELRATQSGKQVANFTVAATHKWKNDNGELQEETEWGRVVAWGKTGELCAKYLRKGSPALIEGRMQTRSWEDKDGNKRYTTEIVASNVQFLGKKGDGDQGETNTTAPAAGGMSVDL
jgi:single-strand DNA-binding protein